MVLPERILHALYVLIQNGPIGINGCGTDIHRTHPHWLWQYPSFGNGKGLIEVDLI